MKWDRATEERTVDLAAAGDLRPSRWLRAGDPRLLAGIAMILGSHHAFDRTRVLALAERLQPGISSASGFNAWLRSTPVAAERFLRLLDARLRERDMVRPPRGGGAARLRRKSPADSNDDN